MTLGTLLTYPKVRRLREESSGACIALMLRNPPTSPSVGDTSRGAIDGVCGILSERGEQKSEDADYNARGWH